MREVGQGRVQVSHLILDRTAPDEAVQPGWIHANGSFEFAESIVELIFLCEENSQIVVGLSLIHI